MHFPALIASGNLDLSLALSLPGSNNAMPKDLPDPRQPNLPLPPFVTKLAVPRSHRLDGGLVHEINTGETQVELMAGLTVPCWGYGPCDGPITSPGPLLEVEADHPVVIRWSNRLPASLVPGQTPPAYPFLTAVVPFDDTSNNESPQNRPGEEGAPPEAARLREAPVGWTTVHLHGGHTEANSDGWPDNMTPAGGSQLAAYSNDSDNMDLGLRKRGVFQWYHDHAMNGTGYHVFAGLFGGYLVRDASEATLGLPVSGDDGEIVMVIQDRNLAVDGEQVRFLHKTTTPDKPNVDGGTAEFFGPLTLVNARLWPFLELRPDVYRLRMLNGSNARAYRLHLVSIDEKATTVTPHHGRLLVIGNEGGLLWKACTLADNDALTLAPAERLDLLIDLTGLPDGQSLYLINSAPAPFQGQPLPDDLWVLWRDGDGGNLNKYPQVMRIDVKAAAETPGKPKALFDTVKSGVTLNPDIRRLVHPDGTPAADEPPPLILGDHEHRLILLGEQPTGMLYLQELVEDDPNGKISIQLPGDKAPKGYRVDGWMTGDPAPSSDRKAFYDHVSIRPTIGQWEIWRFINTTGDVHPIHIHQSLFQPLGSTATAAPVVASYQPNTRDFSAAAIIVDPTKPGRAYEASERFGWKDTIRVNPLEMVSVAIRFDIPGKYVYHCHVLEHEDHTMMRPFVVMVLPMDDGMAGMGHMM